MNFQELRNLIKQFTNEEESLFKFTPEMLGFDISQGAFSNLLGSSLDISPMTMNVNPTDSSIQIEGQSNIDSVNLSTFVNFHIENEEIKYSFIVRLPEDWIFNKLPQLKQLFEHHENLTGIKSEIQHPGFIISNGGTNHNNVQEGIEVPQNFIGCILFSEIEFTGGFIDLLTNVLNVPNTFKLLIQYSAGNVSYIKAVYDVSSNHGAIIFSGIEIYFTMSQFELSCKMQINIGRDTLIFQTGVNFMEQGSIGFVFRLIGVQNNDNQWGAGITRDWVNPLGVPRITIGDLAANYIQTPSGFIINLSGTIKISENQNDEIVLNIEGLQLLNGTLPIGFIGKLHHSNGGEITMTKLINSFIAPLIFPPYNLLDEISVNAFEIYFIPGPTEFESPQDPSIIFSPGIGMYVDGELNSYNVKFHVFREGEASFSIHGQMERFNFCNGMFILTSVSDSNKGPSFEYQQQGERFDINIRVIIFNLAMTTIGAHRKSNNRISFLVGHEVFRENSSGIQSCYCELISSNGFIANFDVNLNLDTQTIPIKILNSNICEVKISVRFALNAIINASADHCNTTAQFNISVFGKNIYVKVDTDDVFDTVQGFENIIIAAAIKEIEDVFKDTSIDDLMDWFNKNWLYFINPIGEVLKDLDIDAKKAAELLNKVSFYQGQYQLILNILNSGGYSTDDLKRIEIPNFPIPTDWIPGTDLIGVNLGTIKPISWG